MPPPRSTESPPGFPKRGSRSSTSPTTSLAHRPKNVVGLVFSEEQAGYLAGHLAALVLTLSPGEEVISSVGGQRVPAVERWIAGYQAGARGANPRVTTLNSYTDDFLDPVKGRSVALSQIAKGSRVVFQVASACGLGALEAASERGIWGIGVDVDQSHLGRHILTSAVKRMDVAVFDTIEELARGTLETGRTSRFSLREPRCRPRHDQRGGAPLAQGRDRGRQGRDRRREDPDRELGHIALSLCDRNPDGPVPGGHVRRRVANRNEAYHPTVLRHRSGRRCRRRCWLRTPLHPSRTGPRALCQPGSSESPFPCPG